MARSGNIRKTIEGYILLFLVCAALSLLLLLVPTKKEKQETVKDETRTNTTLYERQYTMQEQDDYCYVCTGSRSRKYHTTPTCPSSCRREIKRITVAEAVRKGYDFCRTCH
ncbi:MAG: hypothetical protein IJ607_11660 [Bacteroidaceae bacterium]|nr:hypothetical protein [Bacteroidaceae bacterium]